ncbi:MAG: hypothetical protein ACFFAS_13380 [Promethearchaeota archaeon]
MVIADSKDEVGITPIDYFSWGHIDMGIGSFILLSLINIVPTLIEKAEEQINNIPWWLMIVIVIIIMICWELFENTVLYKFGAKFENRKDTLVNATWDVIFGIIGGFYMWIIKGALVNLIGVEMIPAYFIVGIITFLICLIGFFIGRAISK